MFSHETRIKTLEEKDQSHHDKLITDLQAELLKVHGQLTRNNLKIINIPLDVEQQKPLLNYMEE